MAQEIKTYKHTPAEHLSDYLKRLVQAGFFIYQVIPTQSYTQKASSSPGDFTNVMEATVIVDKRE